MNKKFSKVLIGGGIVIFTAVLSVALAQGQGTSTAKSGAGFCSSLTERVSNIEQKISNQIGKLGEAESAREARLNDRWDKFVSDREAARVRQDANLAARIAKLDLTVATDTTKEAVAAFQSDVKSALSAKRDAINAAVNTFHEGVTSLLEMRKTAVEAAFTAREDAFHAAVSKAKDDCAAGVSAGTIRTTLVAALKDAQSKFAAARKANTDFSVKMKTLVAAKKVALDKAQNDFKAALTSAKAALKAVLGESKATSTSQQ